MSEEERTTTITLYKDCKILPAKIFCVDDIETYLSNLTTETKTNFQYLRVTLDMTIKIHKNEYFTAMVAENNYNYLKVVQEERTYYFFILNKTQVAQETISLDIRMDVLNTFKPNTHFYFTHKTKVLREHKDRFVRSWNWGLIKISGEVPSANYSFEPDDEVQFEIDHVMHYARVDEYDDETGEAILDLSEFAYTEQEKKDIYALFSGGTSINFSLHSNPIYGANWEIESAVVLDWKFFRLIDFYSEGLTPILYKEEVGQLEEADTNSWFLLYKNNTYATEDNPQPVECYLVPKNTIEVVDLSSINLSVSDLTAGDYYYFHLEGIQVIYDGNVFTNSYQQIYLGDNWINTIRYYFLLTEDDNHSGRLKVWLYKWEALIGLTLIGTYGNLASVQIKFNGKSVPVHASNSAVTNEAVLSVSNASVSRTSTPVVLKNFQDIDRTDSTIVKLIELPYFPNEHTYDAQGRIIVSDIWSYDGVTGFMKLIDLSSKFESEVKTDIPSPFIPLREVSLNYVTSANRTNEDPKLYHSDYYQPKFIYDSFSFIYQLEKMKEKHYGDLYSDKFNFNYVMTTTMRSRFLFKFNDYDLKYATEDYEKVLSVARNNEAVLYNSPYITYLRTGYNIDVKAKERTEATAVLGGVFSGVGSIAGIGLGVASGNPAIAVKSVISGASSFASSIVNTINTIASAEENMEKKLNTLKAQAVSVEGSDDLDLLENYSNNKAKYAIYKVSPRLRKELDDLFYYTGYVCNELKVPTINTRIWFNFLAADIDITAVSSNIPAICLEALKNLYKEGVTFIHKQNGNYDFEQVKENWERSLALD